MYSTNSGHLIRTLSPQSPGGPDQQVELPAMAHRTSRNFREHAADKSSVPLGDHGPTVVISDPGRLALAPSPSPSSDGLASVGVTCGATGSTTSSSLYETDLATHATNDLGTYSGQDEVAWSPNGQRLALQGDSTVQVFDVRRHSSETGPSMKVASGCRLASPVFLHRTRSPLSGPATAPAEACARAVHSCSTSDQKGRGVDRCRTAGLHLSGVVCRLLRTTHLAGPRQLWECRRCTSTRRTAFGGKPRGADGCAVVSGEPGSPCLPVRWCHSVPAHRRDLEASAIFESGLRADERARMTTST